MYVLGIDVGTQGARALACDAKGNILAQAERPFAREQRATEPGWFEQSPDDWWQATTSCLQGVCAQMRGAGLALAGIGGLSVTSTSGTLVAVDRDGHALGNAIMYNDRRADAEAAEVNQAGQALTAKLGYRFSASFGLPKILWLQRHDPPRYEKARYLLSPTDYVIGKLTGEWGVSDYSNALKTGYDLMEGCWPDFFQAQLGVEIARLPRVVAPGAPVGATTAGLGAATGLPAGIPVLAGMTDGCASQVSTGADAPGQWNSTLGTTLVIKGVTRELIRDPLGRIYCHRHPDGYWLPGGASNTGGECISRRFARHRLDDLNAQVLERAPSPLLFYPLEGKGERFPFAQPEATSFMIGQAGDDLDVYVACLEGVAYVERLAYQVLQSLGAQVGAEIHAAGGATRSRPWLQIRADILDKTLLVPATGGGAMGAAIVAGGGTLYEGIVPAAQAMVRIVDAVPPRPDMRSAYDEAYGRFRQACAERGYLSPDERLQGM